ncbi:MAG: UDP-N-acetylmuramoyl-tripeptide--D-alanyl-D-alanine ligase [Lachnospiraceae bacterium]|nr:UDP-N-acetylmuramoyl-tripeptide--D-alanyl-D-alanine ligase [Lachnospiraceae bacterium]
MKNVTAADVASAVNGRLLCGDPGQLIENIAIDSRTMKGNDIFVPIRGAKVDGHRFIQGAFQAGAVASFTADHEEMDDPSHVYIRVEDTVKALQDLGAWYRSRITFPILGITGSVGKTTTRAMITAALSSERRVTATAGNSNGQLGVPITICDMDLSAQIGILEMGMSEPGEMPRIARVARPQLGVVTNIGVSHIENLGSRENICREKLHLADGFTPDMPMILNGDDDLLRGYRDTKAFRPVFYGLGRDNDYYAEDIHAEAGQVSFTAVHGDRRKSLTLHVPGEHNVMNALAALAAADALGVSWDGAAAGLEAFGGFARRLQIREEAGVTFIDDTYNASPASMKAALQVLSATPARGKRIAVLADMLELGPDAPKYHYETGQYGCTQKVDLVCVIGTLGREIGRAYQEAGIPVIFCESNTEAVDALKTEIHEGDVILLKGSNGMHLNEVLDGLTAGK